MEWVETTGRTIAEALDAALDELGVDEEDVEYEVLEEPKSGFLGRLGSSEGRIRARVKPISREKPGERQRRNAEGLRDRATVAESGSGSNRRTNGGGNGSARQGSGEGAQHVRRAGVGRGSGGSGGGNGGSRRPGCANARVKTSNRGATWTPSRATCRSRSRRPRPSASPRAWSTPSTSVRRPRA